MGYAETKAMLLEFLEPMTYPKFIDFRFDGSETLDCPICGFNYLHLSDCRADLSGESVDLIFSGECGHGATLSVYTRKGNTYARWHSFTKDLPDPFDHLPDDYFDDHPCYDEQEMARPVGPETPDP